MDITKLSYDDLLDLKRQNERRLELIDRAIKLNFVRDMEGIKKYEKESRDIVEQIDFILNQKVG